MLAQTLDELTTVREQRARRWHLYHAALMLYGRIAVDLWSKAEVNGAPHLKRFAASSI